MSPCAERVAPPHWRRIDILSDLHLQADAPRTLAAFTTHLTHTPADAVLLLGDIIEVWVGDDACDDPHGACFERELARRLRESARTRWIGFMPGNRDFLVGDRFLAATGLHRLDDPTCFAAFGHRLLLTHGDAWCLADTDYLAFRRQVRDPAWQQAFLSRPLHERRAVARAMREASQARMSDGGPESWADVDAARALQEVRGAGADHLIHGHTHRPAIHALDARHQRWVLSDWDLDHAPARAEVLVWTAEGLRREPPLA